MRNRMVLCIIIAVLLSLCSCGKKHEKYTTLIADMANDGIISEKEESLWSYKYLTEKCPEKNSCIFDGVTYEGNYDHSIIEKYNSFTTNIYYSDDGVVFGLKKDDGKLVYINLMNNKFWDTEPFLEDVENPEGYCLEYAKKIAENYVSDISSYEVLKKEPSVYSNLKDDKEYTMTLYEYTFHRLVSGYYSSDAIAVLVTSKGHVAQVLTGDIDVFSKKTPKVEDSVLQQKLNSRIKEVYKNAGYSVNDIIIETQVICVTPDGETCVYSSVSLNLAQKEGSTKGTKIRFATFLD